MECYAISYLHITWRITLDIFVGLQRLLNPCCLGGVMMILQGILQNWAKNNMLHPLNPFNITNYNPTQLPNKALTLHLNSMLQESISQTFNLHLLRHFTVNGSLIVTRNGFPMLNISREYMRTLLTNKRHLMFLLKRKHTMM